MTEDAARVRWSGDNEEQMFDFARPYVFRDYTDPELPMKLRSKDQSTSKTLVIGDYVVRRSDGTFAIEPKR